MPPHRAITCAARKTFVFRGRASRSEFWWFWTFHFLLPVGLLVFAISSGSGIALIVGLAIYLLTIPGVISAIVRRRNDVGSAGPLFAGLYGLIIAVILGTAIAAVSAVQSSLSAEMARDLDVTGRPEMAIFASPALLVTAMIDLTFAGLFVAALLAILALPMLGILGGLAIGLSQRSAPGPNRYGPNPHEVTP